MCVIGGRYRRNPVVNRVEGAPQVGRCPAKKLKWGQGRSKISEWARRRRAGPAGAPAARQSRLVRASGAPEPKDGSQNRPAGGGLTRGTHTYDPNSDHIVSLGYTHLGETRRACVSCLLRDRAMSNLEPHATDSLLSKRPPHPERGDNPGPPRKKHHPGPAPEDTPACGASVGQTSQTERADAPAAARRSEPGYESDQTVYYEPPNSPPCGAAPKAKLEQHTRTVTQPAATDIDAVAADLDIPCHESGYDETVRYIHSDEIVRYYHGGTTGTGDVPPEPAVNKPKPVQTVNLPTVVPPPRAEPISLAPCQVQDPNTKTTQNADV